MKRFVLCLGLTVAKPAIAQPSEVPADPYSDRVTLRPLALPRGVIEAQAQLSWASGERFMTDPDPARAIAELSGAPEDGPYGEPGLAEGGPHHSDDVGAAFRRPGSR